VDAELIGRARQLSDVAAALADAVGGRPRVVSIEGDGGAGKTALARRSLADFGVEHRTVVLAADQLTAAVPFATLGPLVVLADDLHWADLASRQALAIAAGRLEHEAVAIVVTARPEHSGVDDGRARLRNDARRCVRVRVGKLTVDDVAALAAQRGVRLTSAAARRLTEHAGGNALGGAASRRVRPGPVRFRAPAAPPGRLRPSAAGRPSPPAPRRGARQRSPRRARPPRRGGRPRRRGSGRRARSGGPVGVRARRCRSRRAAAALGRRTDAGARGARPHPRPGRLAGR
jgi:hypothetical protein